LSEEHLTGICKQILETDKSIRFAGIANDMGSLVATIYRQHLSPLMTKEETSQYAIRAVIRAARREDFEMKLGKLQYSIGKYENLVRATIPIPLSGDDKKSRFFLLISFEVDSDVKSIIESKVLPSIERNKEAFN
jgi:hypothetical protein